MSWHTETWRQCRGARTRRPSGGLGDAPKSGAILSVRIRCSDSDAPRCSDAPTSLTNKFPVEDERHFLERCLGASMNERLLVCLVGPPASGKSSLARRLRQDEGTATVRLRDVLAAATRMDDEIGRAVTTTTDPLGWVSDKVVDAAFRAVLTHAHPLGDELRRHRVLIFDNFPGRAGQVAILADHVHDPMSALAGRRVVSIALNATSTESRRRAARRRICLTCGDSTTEERCEMCGIETVRRPDDRPSPLEAKLVRYRANADQVLSALAGIGLVVGPTRDDPGKLLRELVGERTPA